MTSCRVRAGKFRDKCLVARQVALVSKLYEAGSRQIQESIPKDQITRKFLVMTNKTHASCVIYPKRIKGYCFNYHHHQSLDVVRQRDFGS